MQVLARNNTAPVPIYSGLTSTMSHNPRSSQLSGSTAISSSASSTTLTPSLSQAPATPVNGGPVIATNNIINQKADASRSLYQICVNLRQRLSQVPGFSVHLTNSDEQDAGEEDMDPVSSLWRCLRKGIPLVTLYNTLQPAEPLIPPAESVAEPKKSKMAAFKFVEACMKDLGLPPGECFAIGDLFGDDTTGFVKVTQVINIVLDVAESRGFLTTSAEESAPAIPAGADPKMSYRDYVVRELVDTERKYVQDLENLHELKKRIEQKGVIPGDVVHDIFLNINAILDFQRRFLIKIETTNSQQDDAQQWGLPFTNYEEAFGIYQPFIANQRKAADIAKREFEKIALADHPVVVDFNTLDGFLLKPMQRLVKYPLLLKDLRDKTNANAATKAELTAGIEAANRVLMLANSAVDRELRNEALADLCARVDDWKNHRVDHFGDLLLHGHFPVVTGKSDLQKEYTIYLFERILLCCKEVNPNKSKDKLMGKEKDKKDKKDRNKAQVNKNAKLQLKGRIFMTNVTDVLSSGKQGSYTVQIFWKGDPGVENFIIRFANEDSMKKWYAGVDGQRKEHSTGQQSSSPDNGVADFAWMRDQTAAMPNPYAQEDDDDDEDYMPSSAYGPGSLQPPSGNSTLPNSTLPRTASSNSLRLRSTTGESAQSLASIARAPPPRFPVGMGLPLSVQTSQALPPLPSPNQRAGDSYFSPVAESPASSFSSRTSNASSMFPFPRQGTPQGWEEHARYTAPALGRAPSRESQNSLNAAYQMNVRTPQRPSLPAMASQSQASAAASQRSRSYSTPDINAQIAQQQAGVRRLPNGSMSSQQVPAVPGIPAHLHPAYDGGIPRSMSVSPAGVPIRTSTQSPGVQKERLVQASSYSNGNRNPSQLQLDSRALISPPLNSAMSNDSEMGLPTQLKVKVNCDGNYVTLVVAFNITYQSLTDRIDAKVGRFSNNAIARGTMRLRYRDEDGDFVTIESDDDIQIAFQEWSEAQKQHYHTGQLGEIELFCLSVD